MQPLQKVQTKFIKFLLCHVELQLLVTHYKCQKKTVIFAQRKSFLVKWTFYLVAVLQNKLFLEKFLLALETTYNEQQT